MNAPAKSDTHVLYRFYDANSVLLYIGITRNPPARFKGHATEKAWWDMVAHIKMQNFDSRDELSEAERHAIITEVPRYNVTHNDRRKDLNSDPMYKAAMNALENLMDLARDELHEIESDGAPERLIEDGEDPDAVTEITRIDLLRHNAKVWSAAVNEHLSRLREIRAAFEMHAIATVSGADLEWL